MSSKRLGSVVFVCLLALTSLGLRALPAQASIAGAAIVVNFNNNIISSTSVTTVAIVTDTIRPHKSYIECYFQTNTGQVGIHIHSKDQRRIEALYQQIVTAAAGGIGFQITAYSTATYQPNGYVATLESDLVYLILS